MSSSASLTLTGKTFGVNRLPESTEYRARTTLKKKINDVGFSLSVTDDTLKDQGKTLKDVVVVAERKLGDNVKGALTYDLGGKHAAASVTVDKTFNSSTLTLKATYKQKGDTFLLDETWKFDKQNKLSGSYNFRTEEAVAAYTFSQDTWTAVASYNFSKEAPKLTASKKVRKHTFEAIWEPRAELGTLTWSHKPLKATLKGKVSGTGVQATSASLMLTQEFDL